MPEGTSKSPLPPQLNSVIINPCYGFGDDSTHDPMPEEGETFLSGSLGPRKNLVDTTLEDVIVRIPPSRLPEQGGIARAPELRLRHSRGNI